MICPSCHARITSRDISQDEVVNKKRELKNRSEGTNISVLDFSSQESFRKGLNILLENKQSVFYEEIKRNWNYYSLIDGSPFLEEVLRKRLSESIEYGFLPIVSDFAQKHLSYDQATRQVYNEAHVYQHENEDEGFEFPIYSIIRAVGILYETSILDKTDIHGIARGRGNMQTIFSSMIGVFIKNIKITEENESLEFPTNYHWFIGEIFGIIASLIDVFNRPEYFIESSSYVEYFVFNAKLCINELYKGVEKGKISIRFLASQFYYHILGNFFSVDLNPMLIKEIEREIIADIPGEFVEPIFSFALDKAFAIRFDEFRARKFGFVDQGEGAVLNRLRNFLIESGKLVDR